MHFVQKQKQKKNEKNDRKEEETKNKAKKCATCEYLMTCGNAMQCAAIDVRRVYNNNFFLK